MTAPDYTATDTAYRKAALDAITKDTPTLHNSLTEAVRALEVRATAAAPTAPRLTPDEIDQLGEHFAEYITTNRVYNYAIRRIARAAIARYTTDELLTDLIADEITALLSNDTLTVIKK